MSESSVLLVEVEGSSTVKAVAGMRKVLLPGFRVFLRDIQGIQGSDLTKEFIVIVLENTKIRY
ncbi:MAG: hypothetical protein K6G84_09750 [Lachnospiraceae bacterium]|nr:hypothetical protein [Lachnospiraceae bacterium]